MVFPLFMLLAIAAFLTQLFFCFAAKKLWIKLLPLCLAGVLDALCWLVYFFGMFSEIYGGDFAAFIYGIVLLVMAGVSVLAWLVYGIVKLVQKQRK